MTAALASDSTSPAVRLRPAPAFEPPYDDELGRSWPDQRQPVGAYDVELPLDWGRPTRHPNGRAPRSRTARSAARPSCRPGPTGWQAMPEDLALAIRRFVDLYVEVLNLRRPLTHLRRYASVPAFNAIRLSLTGRRDWWPAPVRSERYARRGLPRRGRTTIDPLAPPARIQVQRLRSCQPAPGVAEVTAVLRRGAEVRAVALRLEREARDWTVTTLDFIG